MSHSQFHSIKLFILRHAWLNLWDKHMTTGRINQVTTVNPMNLPDVALTKQKLAEENSLVGISNHERLLVFWGPTKFCRALGAKTLTLVKPWSVELKSSISEIAKLLFKDTILRQIPLNRPSRYLDIAQFCQSFSFPTALIRKRVRRTIRNWMNGTIHFQNGGLFGAGCSREPGGEATDFSQAFLQIVYI